MKVEEKRQEKLVKSYLRENRSSLRVSQNLRGSIYVRELHIYYLITKPIWWQILGKCKGCVGAAGWHVAAGVSKKGTRETGCSAVSI